MNRKSRISNAIAREDRVRANTQPEINDRIDHQLERTIRLYAAQDAQSITARLEELNEEWDMERALEAHAAGVTLLGLFFATTRSRLWVLVPITMAGFLMRYAFKGWAPQVPILRRMGMRTRMEIERERYALRILRGDFDGLLRRKNGSLSQPEQLAQTICE
jgi:hypothetical protein